MGALCWILVAESGAALASRMFIFNEFSSCSSVSREDTEGLLLMEEEGHPDLISFQPTDSDIPSFLEDCNRVRLTLLL